MNIIITYIVFLKDRRGTKHLQLPEQRELKQWKMLKYFRTWLGPWAMTDTQTDTQIQRVSKLKVIKSTVSSGFEVLHNAGEG